MYSGICRTERIVLTPFLSRVGPFNAVVVADVVIVAIAIVFAVGRVVLIFVETKSFIVKTVVAGHKIDAAERRASGMFVYKSLLPARRVASAPSVPPSPRQNPRTSSRYRPFHSAQRWLPNEPT